VHRHCRGHCDETLKASLLADVPLAELSARAAKEALSLLDYFALMRSTVIQQMLLASANDGNRTAVLAGRVVEVLREIGCLSGELSKIGSMVTINNNVPIFSDPKFIEMQAVADDRPFASRGAERHHRLAVRPERAAIAIEAEQRSPEHDRRGGA
jgi:hypothetical protein